MVHAQPRLTLQGVSKRYQRQRVAYGTLRDLLRVRRRHAPGPDIHALDCIDLEVGAGEIVGVIGPNGAGKSTLLKVIARITPPDQGRIEVRGRSASLIELGAGFHPELTAAENILLHGAIQGLRRAWLRRETEAIVDFAGVREALHVPVKHFSTGMYARLGFAVAVHARPEVLLVDEVYAVGDESFRQRCVERLTQLRAGGTAILFVSHDLAAVRALADRALWLKVGRAAGLGDPAAVIQAYCADVRSHEAAAPDSAPDPATGAESSPRA